MVVLSATFALVSQLYYALSTLPTGLPDTAGGGRCALECLMSPDCGGFVWDTALSPPCQLVVDPTVAGAVPSAATTAYRSSHYRGRWIIELPLDIYSWNSAVVACAALNAKLIDYPKTNQEKAILLLRGSYRLILDLNNEENPSAMDYKDKNGVVADLSFMEWHSTYPTLGNRNCLMVKGKLGQYFDIECDRSYATVTATGAMCNAE